MEVIEGLEKFDLTEKTVVTLGVFDGVHLGHRKIIGAAVEESRKRGIKSVVLTFEPHPLEILEPGDRPPLLTDLAVKAELIGQTGADYLLVTRFNRKFASMTPFDFVLSVLVEKLNAVCVVVGEGYRFGDQGRGDLPVLKDLGVQFGFEVVAVPLVEFQGRFISSTRIRSALENGQLEEAIAMLGHYPILAGNVVSGLAHGRELLGFPTANLELEDDFVIPKSGVYACFVSLDSKRRPSVANLGYSPTLHVLKFRVEVHVLDFAQDIIGQRLEVELVKRLRDEKAFSDEKALSEQIKQDIERARQILKNSD